MRKLAYLLVVAGFSWMVAIQVAQSLRGGIRPILATEYAKIDQGGRSLIPADEVIEIIGDTARRSFDTQPMFVLPGVVMLIGAILLGRRNAAPKRP